MLSRKKGFTLVELLVVIAVIAVLLSILVPAMQKARQLAQRVVCASRSHQLYLAFTMYANENNERVPLAAETSYIMSSYQEADDEDLGDYNVTKGDVRGFCCLLPYLGISKDGESYGKTNHNELAKKFFFCPANKGLTYANNDFGWVHANGWRKTGMMMWSGHENSVPNSALKINQEPSWILCQDAAVLVFPSFGAQLYEPSFLINHKQGGRPSGANVLRLNGRIEWVPYRYKQRESGLYGFKKGVDYIWLIGDEYLLNSRHSDGIAQMFGLPKWPLWPEPSL